MLSMCPPPHPSRHLATVLATDSESDDDVASLPRIFSRPTSVASSRTSHSYSVRSPSPSPSVWSITSSIREQVYRHEYGRGFNNYSEVYRLPADEAELERMNKVQSLIISIIGRYPPPLPSIMADNVPGEQKACLDLGCGSGTWIMELARDFPYCSAVAVDLVPMQCPTMPANCRSEMDDINLGLEHFYGDFNVVHAHHISPGIKDYPNLINQIAWVLRPGGLVDLLECDLYAYDESLKRIEVSTSTVAGPWWPRWLAFCVAGMRSSGGSIEEVKNMERLVRTHPLFEDVVFRDLWLPLTPFKVDDREAVRIGTAMKEDGLAFLKSARPLILKSGLPEHILNEVERNAEAEIRQGRNRYYVRMSHLYARKRRTPPH